MALILTRRPTESIVIDGGIKITVIRINGNQVRLAIEAPDDVNIVREELLLRDKEYCNK